MVKSFDAGGRRIKKDSRVTTLNGNIAGRVIDIEMSWGRVLVSVKWDDGITRPKLAPDALIVVTTENGWR